MASHTILSTDSISIFVMFVLLAFGAMVLMLQMFLSTSENKWAGTVMPMIMFGISLIASYQFALRSINTRSFTGMINGAYVEHVTSIPSIISQTALIFILCNIATGILIAIYTISRRKINNQRALQMMSVQDLG